MPQHDSLGVPDVLIVEDDDDVASLLVAYLRRLECRTTVADSGERGVEAALTRPPQLAIIDIFLPGIDGWKVVEQLAAAPGGSGCRMVTMSVAEIEDSDHPPVDAHLPKPFTWSDVEHIVRPLLEVAAGGAR